MTFPRQWFPPGSQIGLMPDALSYELLLARKDYTAINRLITTNISDNVLYWRRQYHRSRHIYHLAPKRPVHLFFADFWPDFDSGRNQLLDFFRLAINIYGLDVDLRVVGSPDEADISIFSCYGNLRSLHKTEHTTRMLFLGENVRPRYDLFDYSLTFDLPSYFNRNAYCPLWLFELDWFNTAQYPDRTTHPLKCLTESIYVDYSDRMNRVAFVGNNDEPFRRQVLNCLTGNGIVVDTFGSHTNPVNNKINLLKQYKCTLCFENSFYPGYVTEKIIHPIIAGTHMLYSGTLSRNHFFANSPLLNLVDIESPTSAILDAVRAAYAVNNGLTLPPLTDMRQLNKLLRPILSLIYRMLSPYC